MSEEARAISNSPNDAEINQNNNAPRIQEVDVVTPPTFDSLENDNNEGPSLIGKQPGKEDDEQVEDDVSAKNVSTTNVSSDIMDPNVEEEPVINDETTETIENTPQSCDDGKDNNIDKSDNENGSVPAVTNESEECDKSQSETNGAQAKDTTSTPGGLDAACGSSSPKPSSPGDSIYHVKWIHFRNELVPIITQNENGPCPLLAILNVLLLQTRVKIPANTDIVTANQLMTYLGDCVLKNVPSGSDEDMAASARLNFEQNMQDAMAVMYKLQTGIDVNVRFTGIKDFEYTPECIIFDLLQISLYHGWLVDPQNEAEVTAVGTCSYNQLVEKIILEKTSDQTEVVSKALLAEQFLESSASQLTYHGLSELSSQLKDDELVVIFRNNHFTTLYRHNSELFQLVTDQGLLHESNVVWETLSNVEGDCHFVDSEFRTYTKSEPVFNPVENADLNMDGQMEHDYMVALSIQQEQQDSMAWAQVDPQQPIPQISDLELAKSLQEEERRAAAAEQERAPQRQVQGSPRSTGNGGQRQPQRVDSRESKKSDCCIL